LLRGKHHGDVSKVGYFLDITISIADSEFKIKVIFLFIGKKKNIP